MAKKKSKPRKKRQVKDSKRAWNESARVEGYNQNDKQFEGKNGDYGFNPMRPADVGGKAKGGDLTDAQRHEKGIGHGANFGSWCAPSRRLNPRNKKDAKIIRRGVQSIHREKHPYIPCHGINKKKYNENYNEIDWGAGHEGDYEIRKPKKTRKVYK